MKGKVCLIGLLITLLAGSQVSAHRDAFDVSATSQNKVCNSIAKVCDGASGIWMAKANNDPLFVTEESVIDAITKDVHRNLSSGTAIHQSRQALNTEPSGLIPMFCGAVGLTGVIRRRRK